MIISRRRNKKKILVLALSIALSTNVCAMLSEDYERSAISCLKQRAKQSDPQAQHDLGLLYKNGRNQIAKQLFKAVKWFERAALQDHQDAQLMLVRMYLDLDKEGFPKEEQKAVRWVERLVEQNNAEAQNLLGGMYSQGLGVPKDKTESIKWFFLSAEQACVKAQFNLGNKYSKGEGVEVDIKEAIKWYALAAEQGHVNAQIMLNKYSHERKERQNNNNDIQLISMTQQRDRVKLPHPEHLHEVAQNIEQDYEEVRRSDALEYESIGKSIAILEKIEATHNAQNVKIKSAIIGDFGGIHKESKIVAQLVKSWDPDFIITTGDNSFPSGDLETVDENVGPFYSTYIYPYNGKYEKPSVLYNRFFPCLGDNDFYPDNAAPACSYFNFPADKQYYDFIKGAVHFFSLCSDEKCPNGISLESEQMLWLKQRTQESQLPWKIVYFHHPVYSSEMMFFNDENERMFSGKNSERTIYAPFSQWGVSAVLNGHLHVYERFSIDGIPYIINGLGGIKIDEFCDKSPESLVRFSGEHGGMLLEANDKELSFKLITISGQTIDSLVLKK